MIRTYELNSGFSFEQKDGYNLMLPVTIGKLFDYVRGTGPDLFVLKRYTEAGITELTKGVVGLAPDTDVYELKRRQLSLFDKVDGEFDNAKEYITDTSRIYQISDEFNSVVIVKCKDGYLGCGWYDDTGASRKGFMLAGLLLYTLGLINADVDKIFWEATYFYLPYEVDINDPKTVDNIIFRSMEEEIIKQNRENSSVRLISEESEDSDKED